MRGTPVMKVLLAAPLLACTVFAQDAKNSTGQQPLPPIYLNHANIVVNATLYEAINQSKFLNAEFSNGGEHTVTGAYSGRAPYTNISVRGKKTYLEIKNADSLDEKGLKRNPILFIMSIDDRTQLAAVGQSFEREHIHAPIETAMRTFNGHEVKWHDDTDTSKWSDNLDPAHTPWFMVSATYPGYLKEAYPDLRPEEEGTTREKYNARRYKSELLMQDITGFDIDIGADQLAVLMAQFRAMGYALRTEGSVTTANGPELALRWKVVGANTPRAITVHFSLNRTKEGQQVYAFPDSELRFHSDRTASWTFPGIWTKK
jgi:Family of unknown function (DUF5829)